MLVRLAGLVAACAVALLGLLVLPAAAIVVWIVIAACVGPLVALVVHNSDSGPLAGFGTSTVGTAGLGGAADRAHRAWRVGAATSLAVLGACLVLAGLGALVGVAAAPVVAVLLVVTATVRWRRRRAGPQPGPVAPYLDPSPSPSAPDPPNRCEPPDRGTGRAPQLPVLDIGAASTTALCAAWQRTYWLLQDVAPTSSDHLAVIALRVRLLEEFERRDPDGLARWLHTGPRAGSGPGRYLTPTTD